MKTYVCVKFNQRTGKIAQMIEGEMLGSMLFWAMQNVEGKKIIDCIIFEKDTGKVERYFEATGEFPRVFYSDDPALYGKNIDDYCPGLLEAVQED